MRYSMASACLFSSFGCMNHTLQSSELLEPPMDCPTNKIGSHNHFSWSRWFKKWTVNFSLNGFALLASSSTRCWQTANLLVHIAVKAILIGSSPLFHLVVDPRDVRWLKIMLSLSPVLILYRIPRNFRLGEATPFVSI